jgi:hypothetical protein
MPSLRVHCLSITPPLHGTSYDRHLARLLSILLLILRAVEIEIEIVVVER